MIWGLPCYKYTVMKIELVICDLAGTTVKDNRDVHRVLQQAMGKFDINITLEEANQVMGIPKPVAIKMLLESIDSQHPLNNPADIAHIHEVFVSDMVSFYQQDPSVEEKAGVTKTFRLLKDAGIKIGLDTGFDRKVTNAVINRMGWLAQGLVDLSVASDEVERGRPHPDMVHKAMMLLGIKDSKHVAKVGDTPSDLEEGFNAGCGLVIGITSGAFGAEELQKHRHTHLIGKIPELPDILLEK